MCTRTLNSISIDVCESAQLELADDYAREHLRGGPVTARDQLAEQLEAEEHVARVQEAVDDHELAHQHNHIHRLRHKVQPHQTAPELAAYEQSGVRDYMLKIETETNDSGPLLR